MPLFGLKIHKELRSLSSRQLMERNNHDYSTVTDRRRIKHRRKTNENQMKSNILIMKSQCTQKVKKWIEINNNLLEDKEPIKGAYVDSVLLSQRRIQEIHSFLDNPQDSVEFPDSSQDICLETPVSVEFISSQESNNMVELNKEVSLCNNTKELEGTKTNAVISNIEELLESIASNSINLSTSSKTPKEISQNLFVINNLNEIQDDSSHSQKCDVEFDNFLQEICTLKVNEDTAAAINDNALFSLCKTNICQNVANKENEKLVKSVFHEKEKDKNVETKRMRVNNKLFAEKEESLQSTKSIDFCNVLLNTSDNNKESQKSIELIDNDFVEKNVQIHDKSESLNVSNVSTKANSVDSLFIMRPASQLDSGLFNKPFRNDGQSVTRISNKNDETISVNDVRSVDYFQETQTSSDKLTNEKEKIRMDLSYTHNDVSNKSRSGCSTFSKDYNIKENQQSIELIDNSFSGNDFVEKNQTHSLNVSNASTKANSVDRLFIFKSASQLDSGFFNKPFRNDGLNVTRISNKNDETISANSYDVRSVDYFQETQTSSDKLTNEKEKIRMDLSYTNKDVTNKSLSGCSTLSKDYFLDRCNKTCETLISESSKASNINITKKVLRYASSVTSSSYFLEKPKIKKAKRRKCSEINNSSIKVKEQSDYAHSKTSSDYFLDLDERKKIINIDKQLESMKMFNKSYDEYSIQNSQELEYLNKKDMLILDMDKFLEAKDLSQSNKTIPDCIISPMYTFSENYIDLKEAFTNVEIFILKVNAEMDLQEDEESLIDYVNAQMSDVKKHRITSKNNLKIDFQITDKKLQASIDSMLNDKEMVYTSCDFIEYKDNTNLILRKIINIFSALCNRVLKNEKLELTWQKPNYWKDVDYLDNILVCNKPNSMTHTKLNNTRSKARFTIMIYLLKKIYNLLMVDSHINQREIYYQIINYVSSSNQVFSAIDTVSALLKEGTYDLKILSTSKGLAFGNLKIIMKDGEVIKYNKKGGTLIPNIVKNIKDIEASAFFILVVEKDAVFQKLSQENISQKIGRPFILITGKGYPDFSTRLFLKILWKLLSIPIFILADCDPYGIEIMLCYKYGSLSLHMFEELAVPNARWLGVHPSELNLLNIACKKMTENDMRKIRSIAKRSYMRSEPRIGEELKLLLKKRQKAEIEGLIKSNNFLSNFYLPNKLYTKDFM